MALVAASIATKWRWVVLRSTCCNRVDAVKICRGGTCEALQKPSAAQNRLFAETLKGARRNRSAPTLNSKTTYNDVYGRGRTVEELHGAKFPPQGDRQARTHTLGATADNYVKTSYTHTQHRGPHEELTATATQPNHKGNLFLPDKKRTEFWSSRYERDSRFCAENSSSRPPSAGPLEPLPEKHMVVTRGRPIQQDKVRLALPPSIAV